MFVLYTTLLLSQQCISKAIKLSFISDPDPVLNETVHVKVHHQVQFLIFLIYHVTFNFYVVLFQSLFFFFL